MLDWRLGLDLARLSADKSADISFKVDYWKDLLDNNLEHLLVKKHLKMKKKGELYLASNRDSEINGIVVHPLWSNQYVAELLNRNGIDNAEPISIFDLTRSLH